MEENMKLMETMNNEVIDEMASTSVEGLTLKQQIASYVVIGLMSIGAATVGYGVSKAGLKAYNYLKEKKAKKILEDPEEIIEDQVDEDSVEPETESEE